MNRLVVIGTVALDTIHIGHTCMQNVLGGSAVYFASAAQFFKEVYLISTIGKDFSIENKRLLESLSIKLDGLSTIETENTFAWEGEYKKEDMNSAITIQTHLNVINAILYQDSFKIEKFRMYIYGKY